MEAGWLYGPLAEVLGDGLDHRRGTAQVNVHIAVVELGWLDVLGDVAFAWLGAVGGDDDQRVAEVGQGGGKSGELVEFDQVGVGIDTVDQVDRVTAATAGHDLVEHRQEGCEGRGWYSLVVTHGTFDAQPTPPTACGENSAEQK